MAKFELARCLVEKVEQGQRLCNCVNNQISEGYPQARGGWRREVCQFFLIDLNPIYVVVKLELGTYAN